MNIDAVSDVNSSLIIDDKGQKEKLSFNFLEESFNGNTINETEKDIAPEVVNKSDDAKQGDEVRNLLVSGVLSYHVDDLQKMSSHLNELTRNQNIVTETLQQENTRFAEALKLFNLDDVFSRAKLYHAKLQQIKKDMVLVHERSTKLKKRALRLHQQKQKEALLKEQQRDRELERDKQLAPKLATKS